MSKRKLKTAAGIAAEIKRIDKGVASGKYSKSQGAVMKSVLRAVRSLDRLREVSARVHSGKPLRVSDWRFLIGKSKVFRGLR